MSELCLFCGSTGPLTREHVFGQWVSKIGLDRSAAPHTAGRLNRLGRDMGTRPPYQQTVKNFCAACNNGWMSKLETTAQRVLTPLILGEVGTIAVADQPAIAAWAHKTALTAMLVSSEEDRSDGYGLPLTEYTALYAQRALMQLPDATQFWIGKYDGDPGFHSVRVTPMAVRIAGIPEPELPQAYATTIVLGQIVLHALRFTTPMMVIDVVMDVGMPQFWPSAGPVSWPVGPPCTAASFLSLASGKALRSTMKHVELQPWKPATELPQSDAVRGTVQLPTLCDKHSVGYPSLLVQEAARGRFYAFATICDCPLAYLIQTEPDGAHCKEAGEPRVISEIYESLPGEEVCIVDQDGGFVCKRLPTESHGATI